MNNNQRIRNRNLRAYGVIIIAIIVVMVIIIGIYGYITKPSSANVTSTPINTSLLTTPTATISTTTTEPTATDPTSTPEVTASPEPSTNEVYMYVKVTGTKLNMRDKPSTTDSNVIASLDKGVVVTVLGVAEEANDWSKIKTADSIEGYVMTSYLAAPPITINAIVNVTDKMNIRSQPSRTSTLVTTANPNDLVTITQFDITGGWVKIITSDNKVGYCLQEFLKNSEQ